jgi:RNA polymerase sigma factor FliA
LLARYYGDSLTLRESALKMGISEARACQLHGRAIQNLRHALATLVSPQLASPAAA